MLPGFSRVGLGLWTLGGAHWGDDVDDARAHQTVLAAADLGITWIDTAPIYGHGRADAVAAAALRERPGLLVATKVGVRATGTASGHAESDLSPAHVLADAEASLRRLGRPQIDLLQLHWPCQHGAALDDTVAALEGLRERGLIRMWGASNYGADGARALRALGPIASLQAPLSLIRREAEAALLPALAAPRAPGEAAGPVPLIAYEALCRGLLAGRYPGPTRFPPSDQRSWDERFHGARGAQLRALVRDLQRVADHVGLPLPAIAAAFPLTRPGVGHVLVGARTPAQIAQTAGAAALVGRAGLWRALDKLISGWAQGPAAGGPG